MTRPDKLALLILGAVGAVSAVFLYFELTSGSSISPSEAPTSAPPTEPPVSAASDDDCRYFFTALSPVAHDSLSVRAGTFTSLYDGVEYQGCELRFTTHDSLPRTVPVPDFDALPDSEMYRLGWRMSREIRADGPGSGLFGIERESVLCVIRWAQPAYLADDGEIVQSETFSMTVQCRSTAAHLPTGSLTP